MTQTLKKDHPAANLAAQAGRPVETNTLENSMSIDSQNTALPPERLSGDSAQPTTEADWAKIDAAFVHVPWCSYPQGGAHCCATDEPYVAGFATVEGATVTRPPLASVVAWMDEETARLSVNLHLTCEETRYGDDDSNFDVGAHFDAASARALAAQLVRGAELVEAESAARVTSGRRPVGTVTGMGNSTPLAVQAEQLRAFLDERHAAEAAAEEPVRPGRLRRLRDRLRFGKARRGLAHRHLSLLAALPDGGAGDGIVARAREIRSVGEMRRDEAFETVREYLNAAIAAEEAVAGE